MEDFKINNKDQRVLDFLTEDKSRWKRHVLFLSVFFIITFTGNQNTIYGSPVGNYIALNIYIIFVLMFYINMYILVPVFLFKSKYVPYTILLILLATFGITILGFINRNYFYPLLENNLLHDPAFIERNSYLKNDLSRIVIVCASLISVSTTIKLLQRWIKDNKRINELKNITFEMELNELKNQISPHFLFNMLNNVKALIRINPEMANTVIIQLSEFLRYQLYENNKEKVLLISEIEFMTNFLRLEQIRKDNFQVEFENNVKQSDLNRLMIPPGLFTVFIENAIKHSVSLNDDEVYVKVYLTIINNHLHFTCVNSTDSKITINKNTNYNGLGLVNIKRRLELIFGKKHQLQIESTLNKYTVTLIFPV
ncbi:sensor histidine kinase [Flavobacterium sp. I3-2]|uniref:sensor histidine kinase n=1 Tax=Flavobacterium sp. I3-2 TaxID=2748319 RepID=UPI0015B195DF|nr:histidine kinase [Flavobacterium sp. I3-2]